MAIVARNRGRETSRAPARDVDAMMCRLAAMRATSRAVHADPGRGASDHGRRRVATLTEMAPLSEDRRTRLAEVMLRDA